MAAKQGIIKKAKNKKAKYKITKVVAQKVSTVNNKTVISTKKYAYISKKKGSNGKYIYKYS